MPDEQAGSSSAEVDVFNGETPTLAEYTQYRQSGELPERFKPAEQAETAPADSQAEQGSANEDQSDNASDSDTDTDNQEPAAKRKHLTAEERKQQIRATIEKLWEQDEPDTIKIAQLEATFDKIDARAKRKTESAPVTQQQSSPATQEPQQSTHPKPTIDDKNSDGSPKWQTYEDFSEALGRWAAKEERAQWEREYAEREAKKALQSKLDEARARYDDADEVIFPANQAIQTANIDPTIKGVIAGSPEYVDLLYVIGSDHAELEKFLSLAHSNPMAALEKVFEYKRGIREELAKPRDDEGKFTSKEAPEKKTQAPKPPSPVGGGTSRAFDVSDESLSPEEWARKRTQELAKRRG